MGFRELIEGGGEIARASERAQHLHPARERVAIARIELEHARERALGLVALVERLVQRGDALAIPDLVRGLEQPVERVERRNEARLVSGPVVEPGERAQRLGLFGRGGDPALHPADRLIGRAEPRVQPLDFADERAEPLAVARHQRLALVRLERAGRGGRGGRGVGSPLDLRAQPSDRVGGAGRVRVDRVRALVCTERGVGIEELRFVQIAEPDQPRDARVRHCGA